MSGGVLAGGGGAVAAAEAIIRSNVDRHSQLALEKHCLIHFRWLLRSRPYARWLPPPACSPTCTACGVPWHLFVSLCKAFSRRSAGRLPPRGW